jgi:NAD(P)-dependent dehydrogenase (short-subunit alcohol dehydrogenase family)
MTRVAIVTGAGSGIGAATASLLAAHGPSVVLVGRRPELLEAVAAQIGAPALAIAADVGEPSTPALVVERTLSAFGQIDVIVSHAAVIASGPIDGVTRESFDRHYATNVAGPFFLVPAALASLRKAEDPAVVNISSSVGSMVKPGTGLYGSTKAALEYLTRAWAYELGPDRIRVNAIAPGPIDTPIHATYSEDLASTYEDLAQSPSGPDGSRGRHRGLGVVPRGTAVTLEHWERDPRGRRPGARLARGGRRLRSIAARKAPPATTRPAGSRPPDPHPRRRGRLTAGEIVAAIRRWHELYGEPPTTADWDPYKARQIAQHWRAERYRAADWPSTKSVRNHFGRMSAAVVAAGLVPRYQGQERPQPELAPDEDLLLHLAHLRVMRGGSPRRSLAAGAP